MSILAAILAVIIFANPFISALDLLPDVFGCLLIWFATRRAEFFSPKLEEARRLWLKLALLTGIDAVLAGVISPNDGTMILLVAFVFRISEAVMLYFAATKTLDGMLYLGTKFDGTGIYMPASERKAKRASKKEAAEREKLDRMLDRERERYERGTSETVDEEHRHRATERYRRAVAEISAAANKKKYARDGISALSRSTFIFVLIRTLMCVLPEFTVLGLYGRDVTSGYKPGLYQFRGLFVSLGIMISAVVSVIWLVHMLRYIIGIWRDKYFCRAVRERYSEYTSSHSDYTAYRMISASLIVIGFGLALTFDFFVDNNNIVPDFVSAAFFLIFFILMRKNGKHPLFGAIVSAVYGIVSAAQWFSVRSYVDKFTDFTHTVNSERAFDAYVICCVLSFAAEVVFIVLSVLAFRELSGIISGHTGYMSEDGKIDDRTKYIRAELTKQNVRTLVAAIIVAVTSVVQMIALGINKQVTVREELVEGYSEYIIYVPRFESIGTIKVIVSAAFAIMAVKFISDIYDSVKERYKYL